MSSVTITVHKYNTTITPLWVHHEDLKDLQQDSGMSRFWFLAALCRSM